MKWYVAAGQLWTRQIEAPVPIGYCSAGLPSFDARSLCRSYPELVTTVPGEGPSAGNSFDFSVAMVAMQTRLAEATVAMGKKYKGSTGVIYGLALQEAWRRAGFDATNAKRLLDGEKAEKAEEESFDADPQTELRYLTVEADKYMERRR